METFVTGELWGNGSGSSAILNTGFEIGKTIEVGRHDCLMRMRATIGGTAPSSVDLKIEYATPEDPSVFYELPLPGDGVFDNSDWVEDILFLPRFFYRISAKRTDGDNTTSLYLYGTLRDNRIVEGAALTRAGGAVLWIRAVLGYLYDTVKNALRVSNISGPETVMRSETLFDVTGGADGTYDYYVEHDGFHTFLIHYQPSGAGTKTLTVWASAQDDGTPIASRQYVDVTASVFSSPSFTTEAFLRDSGGDLRDAKSLLFKIVVSGGAGSANWKGYYKTSY